MSEYILNMWRTNITNWYDLLSELQLESLDEFEDFADEFEEDTAPTLYNDGQRLNLQSLTDDMCIQLFRFTYHQIQSVVSSMGLADTIAFRANTSHQFYWNTIEAFAIMLRRLAYPSRLIDLELLFGISYSTVCVIFNEMIVLLYTKYNRGIRLAKNHLSPYNLKRFNEAIIQKGSPYSEVIGFIDGTLNAVCRPGENQEGLYNGHVKQHGLKYQGIVTPDGITVSLCGPFAGAIHDMNMLDSSDIVLEFEELLNCEDIGEKFYALYGDPAYRQSPCVIRPFPSGLALTDDQRTTNQLMSSVRECVEWEFGHVATLFAFVRFRPGQKVYLSRVGMFYVVATLIKNIHTCVNNGNQTSFYFAIQPPTLQEYIDRITNV